MVYWALFLIVIGILFLTMEIFIPGFGLFGIMSFISIISSFFIVFIYIPYGFLIIILEILLFITALIILFYVIKKRNVVKKIVLSENLNEMKDYNPNDFINKIGITTTMLKPSGFVKFDIDTIEVYSQSGLINPNTKVKVTEVKNKKVFVAKI